MKEKETKHKTITIDLDNKQIYSSNSTVRNLLLNSKLINGNPFTAFDFSSYEVKKLDKNKGKTVGDKLDLNGIKEYVKNNVPELLNELEDLINAQAKDKNGNLLFKRDNKTPKKTSFLVIKNWFYEQFPELKPQKNKKS